MVVLSVSESKSAKTLNSLFKILLYFVFFIMFISFHYYNVFTLMIYRKQPHYIINKQKYPYIDRGYQYKRYLQHLRPIINLT
ncbi:hypothetical protein LPICM17_350009 [Lactococcus piscium]|nr:hypothetical protein LPICM17_350009 [Lactococcus piscium]